MSEDHANQGFYQSQIEKEYVFEVVDSSDDCMYHTLGVFKTLEEVKSSLILIDEAKEAATETGREGEDTESVSVYRRTLGGWYDLGTLVLEIYRERRYSEEEDEYFWQTIEVVDKGKFSPKN